LLWQAMGWSLGLSYRTRRSRDFGTTSLRAFGPLVRFLVPESRDLTTVSSEVI